jgi:P-type E1-E2 ATPase
VGDLVRVLPGERAPIDGLVLVGQAAFDEHIATGESRPVVKSAGAAVHSGSLNLDGDIWVQVTAAAGQDLVSRMLQLVRDARRQKGRHERLADRIAAWFTPLVCVIAVAAGVWHGVADGADRGILVGLAVVLIACPCALGLATPMAIWSALGRAADLQVVFRSGAVIERLAQVATVCFDKTGTLTRGLPEVTAFVPAHDADGETSLRLGSRTSTSPAEVRTFGGRGVAQVDDAGNIVALLGSARWIAELNLEIPSELTSQLAATNAADSPLSFLACDGVVLGAFVFRESLRPEAAAALADCRALNLKTLLLTGDRGGRAASVARQLGVEALADQLPEDKVDSLRQLGGKVAMVGDGLNDAPALAAADVGIALGCGADLSREAAGVCLLADRLDRVPWSIALARKTVQVVRQNLFWAFVYNIGGVALAAAGRLNPMWAAGAMGLSSVIVIVNSLRLARFPENLARQSSQQPKDALEFDAARLEERAETPGVGTTMAELALAPETLVNPATDDAERLLAGAAS